MIVTVIGSCACASCWEIGIGTGAGGLATVSVIDEIVLGTVTDGVNGSESGGEGACENDVVQVIHDAAD